MRTPKPATTRAFLMSAGYDRPVATIHLYYDTLPCMLAKEPDLTGYVAMEPAWEHRFQCFKTGAIRRWGTEHREIGEETPEHN